MKCPYCDGEMQDGDLMVDGRSPVSWKPSGMENRSLWESWKTVENVGVEGFKLKMKGAYCDNCKKMIIETVVH